MVSHSGTSPRTDQLRPLNRPKQIDVVVEQRRPIVVVEQSHRYRIEQIQDSWIIDDEWWRDPISRQYFQVMLEGGSLRTIFHDRTANTWFVQSY
jgi:hypothetical protein